MFASRPVVHPLEVAAPADPVQQPPGVLLKDLPGMPGTPGGLGLRVLQLLFAAVSLAAMSSAVDFASVSAFRYLLFTTYLLIMGYVVGTFANSENRDSVDLLGQNDNFTVLSFFVVVAANSCLRYLIATTILQCVWSLTVAIVDIYALLVKRCLRNRRAVALFAIGDGITWAGSFSGACMAAGVTVLIDTDLSMCYENHCANFQTAVAMEFMCCFSLLPSLLLNLYSMASSRG